jgi:hypothetical protein
MGLFAARALLLLSPLPKSVVSESALPDLSTVSPPVRRAGRLCVPLGVVGFERPSLVNSTSAAVIPYAIIFCAWPSASIWATEKLLPGARTSIPFRMSVGVLLSIA